jgi:hypothetical protein
VPTEPYFEQMSMMQLPYEYARFLLTESVFRI